MADNFKPLYFDIEAIENGESVQEDLDETAKHVPIKILYDKANNKFKKENQEQVHRNRLRNALWKSIY